MPLGSGGSRAPPRAQLTIPRVPKFPLSSPITDEIASPTSSEEERERNGERDSYVEWNRPFDFLAKMSSKGQNASLNPYTGGRTAEEVQVVEHSVAVGKPQTYVTSATTTMTSTDSREGSSRRPVGLNLDIPGSTSQTQQQPRKETANAFVDLNDLKVLSKAREEERTAAKLKGILKKGDAKKTKGDTRGFQRLADDSSNFSESRKRASLLDASRARGAERKVGDKIDGISPTDRPIMIGFSVPYDSPELVDNDDDKQKELDSAGTQFTPLTPSIIVTPAKEDGESFWGHGHGHLSPEDTHTHARRPRAASSVYSQPSPHLGHSPDDAPPVPAVSAMYSTGNNSSATSARAAVIETSAVRKRRSMSASVVNSEKVEELDEKPRGRARSNSTDSEKVHSKPSDRLTINTASALNARQSQGWWNYLLSPLLSASSLLSPKTPTTTKTRPTLPTIETSSTGLTDDWWEEKEKWDEKENEKERGPERSYFSPDTPDATRRISSWQRGMSGTNPFADFDWSIDEQGQGQARGMSDSGSPEGEGADRGVSMMFSGQRIQGAAAEYYQACAHELFSGRPYFECEGHICSITPEDRIAAMVAEGDIDGDGNRSLEGAEEGNKNLLIDVDDVPRSNNLESPAPSGITSINSSPSDESNRLSASLAGSRAAPSERAGESPRLDSPGGARGPPSPGPSTNPFLEQPRGYPSPVQAAPNNIHVEAPPPANIHIEAPAAPAAPPPANYHYEAPYQPAASAPPMAVDAPGPFEASRGPEPSPNPFSNPEYYEQPRGATASHNPFEPSRTPTPQPQPQPRTRAVPAPIAMPSPEQTPPPNYGAQAYSPYPRSPESLQSPTARGAIRMSNMSMPAGPAPAYTPHNDVDNNHSTGYVGCQPLPARIRAAPITREDLDHPYGTQTRIEARRRRYEAEDNAARKAGGFWRGRGPFSNKGCFGRSGREGRLRRRWYAAICLLFVAIVVGAVLLAVFLTRNGDGTPVQSQWLNLTGYPPMPTGISTIAGPENQEAESGCIKPTSLWSCALPKEQQDANEPYAANRPNFRVEIRFQNGTYNHSTALANETDTKALDTRSLFARSVNQLYNPSPDPPSEKEQAFLGKTTDNITAPYKGEETPFYITFLSTQHLSSSSDLHKRDNDSSDSDSDSKSNTTAFPNLDKLIPSPPVDSDGTAAPAVLHPLPSSQPVRLYNRGEDSEHYGFYSYFDKSIFLSSDASLTDSGENAKGDLDGGSTKKDARVRCTWSETRFLVKIWTKGDKLGRRLLDRNNGTTTGNSNSTTTDSQNRNSTTTTMTNSTSSALDFVSPGSFPYPVTITLDRHGGDAAKKTVYCYGMIEGMHINGTEVKLQMEDRGFGGTLVNSAPGIFNFGSSGGNETDSDSEDGEKEGGYDGGSGGCGCEWVNWVGAV
ncbi:hypothetical protein BDW69DRAFT_195430 [Aspergillus filifer]